MFWTEIKNILRTILRYESALWISLSSNPKMNVTIRFAKRKTVSFNDP